MTDKTTPNFVGIVIKNIDTIFLAVFSFVLIRVFLLAPDYDQHTLFIQNYSCLISQEFYQPHFLLFRFIWLITLGTCNYNTILLALQIVVCIFIGVKYAIIKKKIEETFLSDNTEQRNPFWTNTTITLAVIFFTLFLSICISIPNYLLIKNHWLFVYIVNPNCWHNSTYLVTLPFSILMFFQGFRLINDPDTRNTLTAILLVFLNVFIKPVYFLSFAPVFFLFTLYFNGISKKFAASLLPVFFGGLCLLFQLFVLSKNIYSAGGKGIRLDFFALFEPHYGSIWIFILSLFFAFAFPIAFYILNPQFIGEKESVFSFLTTLLSLLLVLFFVEDGTRLTAGNFLWGLMASVNLLFTVAVIFFIRKYKSARFDLRFYVPFLVLCLHYLAGFAYILKIIVKGWYT